MADEVGENLLLIVFGGTVTAGRERKSNLGEEREKESLKYSDGFGDRETMVCLVELKSL